MLADSRGEGRVIVLEFFGLGILDLRATARIARPLDPNWTRLLFSCSGADFHAMSGRERYDIWDEMEKRSTVFNCFLKNCYAQNAI